MFEKFINYISLLVILSFLTGCAVFNNALDKTGEKFKEIKTNNKDKATVYIYRLVGPPQLRSPEISINDKVVGDLATNNYAGFTVDPGVYRIKVDWSFDILFINEPEIKFTANRGETYFFRVSTVSVLLVPVVTNKTTIDDVEKDEALSELKQCTLIHDFDSDSFSM